MKVFKSVGFCVASIMGLASSSAQAYMVGRLGSNQVPNPSVETHILVVGYSHGMGSQFLEAAVGTGLRYLDAFPGRQVVIMQEHEGTLEDSVSKMKRRGVTVFEKTSEHLWSSNVVNKVRSFSRVASLEFFSHSSMHWGAGLVENSNELGRFFAKTKEVHKIRANLTRDGFIFFHGCNTGLATAPDLSAVVKAPVAGALTSSDFEELATDQKWYNNNSGNYPSSGWSSVNQVSYSQPMSCKDGKCHRMRPDNHPYRGMWGSYNGGGLPFYKFFCNYSGDSQACLRAMATSLISWPSIKPLKVSSSLADAEEVVLDFLCPTDKEQKVRKACIDGIRRAASDGSEVYSPFRGNSLECDMNGCSHRWECKYDASGAAIPGSCVVVADKNPAPRTITQEYKRYLQGFKLLQP